MRNRYEGASKPRIDPEDGRRVLPHHCAGQTGKTEFIAYQASKRGGVLYCTYAGERTVIRGKAALFAESEIYI